MSEVDNSCLEGAFFSQIGIFRHEPKGKATKSGLEGEDSKKRSTDPREKIKK